MFVLPGLQHNCVLGMDFLAKHNPAVDFAARVMTFADGTVVSSPDLGSSDAVSLRDGV